jgi:adenosine deaminase
MANLKRRVARLEAVRAPEPPRVGPEEIEEMVSLLRQAAARVGAEYVVADIAPALANNSGIPVEEVAEALREAVSDVAATSFKGVSG